MKHGIAKINVGTEIRQPYEVALRETGSVVKAQQAVYDRTAFLLRVFPMHCWLAGKIDFARSVARGFLAPASLLMNKKDNAGMTFAFKPDSRTNPPAH